MEDSFFEYRDKTEVDSESDSEVIDNSLMEEVPFSAKKKNNTVFVAESEESTDDDETDVDQLKKLNASKSVVRRSSVIEAHVISSSDEDASRKGSIRRQMDSDNLVLSSSDDDEGSDEEISPELVPKRRPPLRPKSIDSNDSIIARKTKKRIFLIDSDTDNSIVIEHEKHKKLTCLKVTPLKIDSKVNKIDKDTDKSMDYDDSDEASQNDDSKSVIDEDVSENDDEKSENDKSKSKIDISENNDEESENDNSKSKIVEDETENDTNISKTNQSVGNESIVSEEGNTPSKSSVIPTSRDVSHEFDHNYFGKSDDVKLNAETDLNTYDTSHNDNKYDKSDQNDDHNDDEKDNNDLNNDETDDDGPDEDLMVMSRATRMSIMGVIPKDDESDDSDYIQSDESSRKSKDSLANSLTDLPEVSIVVPKTPEKQTIPDGDSSRLTCSPFSSPLHDITNDLNKSSHSPKDKPEVIDLSNVEYYPVNNKVLNKLANNSMVGKENFYDDDVAIIENKSEIIALSSDDEDEVKITEKKSPRPSGRKSPKPSDEVTFKHEARSTVDIKQYLVPPSAPNQIIYVKRHVRENELNKLRGLQEDLNSVKRLLEEMDFDSLPDGGSKLIERLSRLEAEVRRQGDRVGNMVVEPDAPTAQDIAKDGFEKGLSWEDIQKASNAVQPRMFGKQAMATHMAERNLIIDRLRHLHESLASRPSETTLATSPRIMASKLMSYQLHALAWLKWRETQRPCAGILADDMGLGKTITMISLIASDKEGNMDDDEDDDLDEQPVKGKLIRGGTLVVCPASLIQQWAGEVKKHCVPHSLSTCLHHGAARASQPHRLATYDLVATTYNILQRDAEKNGVLMRVQWRRVILDEAHIVRNHKSATSMAVCGLRASRRWCLTGTPVQNKDLDLFALLKFLRCSPFDELQMWKKWIDNKSQGGQERLSTIMRCILLRRTKVQLQQKGQLDCLPSRTPHITEVTLNQHEMNVYQKVLVLSKSLFAQFLQQRAEKNADSTSFASKNQDSEYHKMHKRMIALQGVKPVKSHEILVLLLRLRQVCCHCGLIAAMLDEQTADQPPDAASEDLLHELDKLSLNDSSSRRKSGRGEALESEEPQECATATEAIRAVLSPNNPVIELARPSSKIQAVMDCLINNVFANKGDKAVVVSQWTSVLRLVQAELEARRVRSVTLSGSVPVAARPQLIDALNDPNSAVKVMLLSLCAGGVGINLCGANHLLLLDPHWNPQLEEQAQDRIYRVGQKKDVHIYRFMCVGTVEQTIRKLQEAKLNLAENVLTGARNNAASTLSIEDLKMMFNMGNHSA